MVLRYTYCIKSTKILFVYCTFHTLPFFSLQILDCYSMDHPTLEQATHRHWHQVYQFKIVTFIIAQRVSNVYFRSINFWITDKKKFFSSSSSKIAWNRDKLIPVAKIQQLSVKFKFSWSKKYFRKLNSSKKLKLSS